VLIGYVPQRDCDWIDTKDAWAAVLTRHATQVAEALQSTARHPQSITAKEARVMINGKAKITFMVARQSKKKAPGHATHWRVYRRQKQSGLLAVLRLDSANRDITDYVLVPASAIAKKYLRLSETSEPNRQRFMTLAALIKECKKRLGRTAEPCL
jgi:hypothetical protein